MIKFLISIFVILSAPAALNAADPVAPVTTCGYFDGVPQRSWLAPLGYVCRVDTANGLWGFCPTSVASIRDCGLAGFCVDSHSCTKGCGRLSDRTDITTFSWLVTSLFFRQWEVFLELKVLSEPAQSCATVLSINGPDQSFEYIACSDKAGTDSLLAVPSAVDATTTSASSSVRSTSLASPTLQTTKSIEQTPKPLASSSSVLSSLFTPSSTSNPTPGPAEQKSINIGAIVGGVIGGLTVICLIILGVVLIRRKHGTKEQAVQPPDYTYNDPNNFANNAESTQNSRWDSSYGPVEMREGHHVNMDPAELPGFYVQSTDNVSELK